MTAFATGVSVGGAGSFIEMANLNGAQVACTAIGRQLLHPSQGDLCSLLTFLGVTARTTPSA